MSHDELDRGYMQRGPEFMKLGFYTTDTTALDRKYMKSS